MNLQGKVKIVPRGGRAAPTNPSCQITHKPTGTVATASSERSMLRGFNLALQLLRGLLRHPAKPSHRVRTYDLTPGMMRIHGGGIETTDPKEIEAIMGRGEIPLSRWQKESGAK